MKKLIYLIIAITVLALIVVGCTTSVVPPTEQNETSGLTKGSIIYVDDDGGGPYTTIQAAIDAAVDGDTISVAAGTYSESNITIEKSLTILGAPGDSAPGPAVGAPIIDGGGDVADAFDLVDGVSNVTISGFEIRNFGTSGWTNGSGVGIQAWVPSTSNITVSDNWFHDVGYGVMAGNDGSSVKYALGTHTNWTVSGNIIEEFSSIGVELTDTSNSSVHGNVIHMAGGSTTGQIGIFSWVHISQSGLTVSGNTIDGAMVLYPTVYMYAYDDASPSPNLNDVTIENNTISTTGSPFQVYLRDIGTGTVTGVHVNYNNLTGLNGLKNLTAVSVDATCNWWGDASGPYHSTNPSDTGAAVSDNVNFCPWLDSAYPSGNCSGGAPVIEPIEISPNPVEQGTSTMLTANFTGPAGGTATIDWGDGNTTAEGVVNDVAGTVTGSYIYAEAGVYTVVVTLTTICGSSDPVEFQYAVVYDPTGGFVTGGGWIDSPEGASTHYPDAVGKATFGFVSKYKKGAAVPTGKTEFQFKAGDLNFHSDTYDWLVIAGAKAMYKGTGTINGTGEYKFMLSAIDADINENNSLGVDCFRIKIWDTIVIYDNQMADVDDAEPTTEIAGGQIVIHKAK